MTPVDKIAPDHALVKVGKIIQLVRKPSRPLHPFIALWRRKDLTFFERGVISAMRTFANKDGTCWPTLPQLKALTGMSEDFIDERLKSARTKGAITWESFRDSWGRARRRYVLLFVKQDALQPPLLREDRPNCAKSHGG